MTQEYYKKKWEACLSERVLTEQEQIKDLQSKLAKAKDALELVANKSFGQLSKLEFHSIAINALKELEQC